MEQEKEGRRASDEILLQLKRDFENHKQKEERDRKESNDLQKANAEAIRELTQCVKQLTNDTREMVQIWNAGKGVLKFGSLLGRLAKWLSSIAIFGVIFAWVFKKLGGL